AGNRRPRAAGRRGGAAFRTGGRMSYHLMVDVLYRSQARPIARLVLVALAERADKSGRCWPTLRKLSTGTGLCRTAVLKALKELESSGARTITRRHRHANRYQITLPVAVRVRQTDSTRVRVADSTPRTVGYAGQTPGVRGTDSGGTRDRLQPVREPVKE